MAAFNAQPVLRFFDNMGTMEYNQKKSDNFRCKLCAHVTIITVRKDREEDDLNRLYSHLQSAHEEQYNILEKEEDAETMKTQAAKILEISEQMEKASMEFAEKAQEHFDLLAKLNRDMKRKMNKFLNASM